MTTVADLLPRVQRNLSQLGGVGVQTYSQDSIIEKMQTSFNMLFTKYFWDEYNHWREVTLDGTLGVATDTPYDWEYSLIDFVDIQGVHVDHGPPLPALPANMIPDLLTGTRPKFIHRYKIDPEKVFRVAPYTSTGKVWVRYRARPKVFDLDTDILLDEELMKLAATYQYLADDGTNPDATNAAFSMLNARERVVIAAMSNQPVPLNSRRARFSLSEWYG